jgi:hypothetical protein
LEKLSKGNIIMKYSFAFITLLTMQATAMATDPVADIKKESAVTKSSSAVMEANPVADVKNDSVVNARSSMVDPFAGLACESIMQLLTKARLNPANTDKCKFKHNGKIWHIDTKAVETLATVTHDKHAPRPEEIKFDRVEEAEDRIRFHYNATMIDPYAVQAADTTYQFWLTFFPPKKG